MSTSIVEQLTYVYSNLEMWHKNKLSKEEADVYHERLLVNGNILTYIQDNELKGYLEFWRLDFHQFGRLICGKPIMTDQEDLLHGNIAYINNMYISPDDRNGKVFEIISGMFLARNKDADYYCAFRRLKRNQPVQVYTKEEILKHFKK